VLAEHFEAIKLLMPIFNYEYADDDADDDEDEDILDKMHQVMINMGELAIVPLRDYLNDSTRHNRSDAAEILGTPLPSMLIQSVSFSRVAE
jgi:hypothetical protein